MAVLEDLGKNAPKIVSQSINSGIRTTKTELWREVKAAYTIQQEVFYERIYSVFSTPEKHVGSVKALAKPAVGLQYYKHSVTRKGIKATIRKAEGAKLAYSAFKSTPLHGNIFRRVFRPQGLVLTEMSKKRAMRVPWKRLVEQKKLPEQVRLPIRRLFSLSAAQIVDDGTILEKMETFGADKIQSELDRQVQRALEATT